MSGKIIGQGKCKHCGEIIRWSITGNGLFQPIQLDDNEPHFPHCGKQSYTAIEWAEYLEHVAKQIRRNNAIRRNTNPKNLKNHYSGDAPPWE